ncbi:uncharacterized protein LOC112562568 isoform X2 [Pomacea canaliculata]|nr:uncharacterized protein LOC112562568 isoform X2 [Pomacea canaliculata]
MFKDRLIVSNEGKVTLNDLTPDDHGRYRVEYQLAENKHTYNISLVIKEPPETIDGKLFVMKKYSPNENSIRLMCGMFTTLGFPPALAVWKDPAGRTLSSDGFKDEYFYLDVPADTADSGDYCCQLDCRAPDFCCLDDQSPLRSCATVHVRTNKKIEVTPTPNISLEPFTKLQENVSNSTKNLVDLSELHIQNCSNQADEYMSKVQTLEEDIRKELENVVNISAEARRQLEKETMQMFWNFQLQVDYNLSIAVESCRELQEHFMKAATGLESKRTNTSDKVEAMEQRLDTKLTEIQQYSDKADGRLETNVNYSIESLQNFQRQLDYNMSLSLESFKELQKRLMETDMRQEVTWTSVLDKVEALRKKLDKGGEIEIQISEVSGIVDELKQRIDVDLAEIRTSGLAADIILEANMNRSFEILQSFQLQLDYNISSCELTR